MRRSYCFIDILSVGFFLLEEGSLSTVTIVVPAGADTVAYDQALLLVASASKESFPTLRVEVSTNRSCLTRISCEGC